MSVLSTLSFFPRRALCESVYFSSLINVSFQRSFGFKIFARFPSKSTLSYINLRYQSSNTDSEKGVVGKLTQSEKLKQAVRDYGLTIIVFHIVLSLASLGLCYLAVSNGVDAVSLLKQIGFSESVVSNKIAVGGSTFVIAYAVHKLFVPVRMGITITAAPFVVRYLRSVNLIKSPKPKL